MLLSPTFLELREIFSLRTNCMPYGFNLSILARGANAANSLDREFRQCMPTPAYHTLHHRLLRADH